MTKYRRLEDLYVVGKEVLINDDSGGQPARLYLRKLNPLEQEKALRKANAARARTLASCRNLDSDEYVTRYADAFEMTREQQIDLLIAEEVAKIRFSRESEIGAEDEWSDEDYLQGLRDAWNDGLSDTFQTDTEDPESKRVFDELTRFEEQVTQAMSGERDALARGYEDKSEDDLLGLVTKRLVELESDSAWVREFRRCEVWLSTRNAETKKPYFADREDVDALPLPIVKRLIDEYQALSITLVEGKDLPGTPAS